MYQQEKLTLTYVPDMSNGPSETKGERTPGDTLTQFSANLDDLESQIQFYMWSY